MDAIGNGDALFETARAIHPPAPHERKDVLRSEAALLLDALITRAARGSGAYEMNVADYAETVLGIARSTAKMERRARYLRERPLRRCWRGPISTCGCPCGCASCSRR